MLRKVKRRMTVWRYLALGYFLLISVGTGLLMLPVASSDGSTAFVDALFTATSALCVTGLTPVVTGVHWTVFGQVVILCLIQTGGLGFTTFVTVLLLALKRNALGLYARTAMVQSVGENKLSGVKKLVKRIFLGTFVFELTGALLLMIRFLPRYGAIGVYYAFFHAISAFCNAGFDIIGLSGQSLSDYATDPLVSLTICFLIILGGLGFCVWGDVTDSKGNPAKFQFYTKIALGGTALLLACGTGLFLLFERDNPLYESYGFGEKLLCSFFNATTARTAGFFTTDPSRLSNSGCLLMIILMFIGACSGSTGGGIKVSTFIVIFMGMISVLRGKKDITVGRRRIDSALMNQALAIFAAYLCLAVTATLIINTVEPDSVASFSAVLFEVVSALGTVGLSMSLTPSLSAASKLILVALMYLGRVGVLTFALALKRKKQTETAAHRPIDNVFIG